MICPLYNDDYTRLLSQIGFNDDLAHAIWDKEGQRWPYYAESIPQIIAEQDFPKDMMFENDISADLNKRYDNVHFTAVRLGDRKYYHKINVLPIPYNTDMEFLQEEEPLENPAAIFEMIEEPDASVIQMSQEYIRGFATKAQAGKALGITRQQVSGLQMRMANNRLAKYNYKNGRSLFINWSPVGKADLNTWEIVDKAPSAVVKEPKVKAEKLSDSQLEMEFSRGKFQEQAAGKEVQKFLAHIMAKFPGLKRKNITVEESTQMFKEEKGSTRGDMTILEVAGPVSSNLQILLPKTLNTLQKQFPGLTYTISDNKVTIKYNGKATKGELSAAISSIQEAFLNETGLEANNRYEVSLNNPFDVDMSTVPAFYKGNTIYIVDSNIGLDTLVHEVLHPFVDAFALSNPNEFQSLYAMLYENEDTRASIVDVVNQDYAYADSITRMKEVIVRALTPGAVSKVNLETGELIIDAPLPAETKNLIQRIKDWVSDFVNSVLNKFRSSKNQVGFKNVLDAKLADVLATIYSQEGVFDTDPISPEMQAFKAQFGFKKDPNAQVTGSYGTNRSHLSPARSAKEMPREKLYDDILERAKLISDKKYIDPVTGEEFYQTISGEVRTNRPSMAAKKLYKNKGMNDDTKNLIKTGTLAHSWKEYYMYKAIQESKEGLIDYKGSKIPTKPSDGNLDEDAIKAIRLAAYKVIADIEKKQDTKNKQATARLQASAAKDVKVTPVKEKAWVMLEVLLDDPRRKITGTVDIMAIYSDSKVDILDNKFMKARFRQSINGDEVTYIQDYEVHSIKRKAAELQIGEYKKMVMSYGVNYDQFEWLRVIPYYINFRYNRATKTETNEVESIESISSNTDLNYVITNRELTQNNEMNTVLQEIYKKKESLEEEFKKSYSMGTAYHNKIRTELDILDKAIDEIVLHHGLTHITRYIYNISEYVNKNIENMDLEQLSKLANSLRFSTDLLRIAQTSVSTISKEVKQIAVDIDGNIINVSEEEEKIKKKADDGAPSKDALPFDKQLSFVGVNKQKFSKAMTDNFHHIGLATSKASAALHMIEEKLYEKFGEDNSRIQDIVANNGGFLQQLDPFSQIDNPIFESASKLINEANARIEKHSIALVEEVVKVKEKIAKYAKSKGISVSSVYASIYNKETGQLQRQFSKDFETAKRKADKDDDVKWMKAYYKLKEGAVKKYEAEKKKVIKDYEASYGKGTPEFESAFKYWESRNDLTQDSAWKVKYTRYEYLELKNPEAHYSDFYKSLDSTVKELYDYHISKYSEFNDMIPEYVYSGFVANVKKEADEILNLVSQFNLKGAAKAASLMWKNTFRLRYHSKLEMQDSNSLENFQIPLMYYDSFEYWDDKMGEFRAGYTKGSGGLEKSEDLLYNLILFGRSVFYKHEMENIKDNLVALEVLLRKQKTYKTDMFGNIVQKQVGIPEVETGNEALKRDFEKLVLMHAAGKGITTKDTLTYVPGLGNISKNKVLSSLYGATRFVALAGHYIVATSGFLNGFSSTYIESAKKKAFSAADWKKAILDGVQLARKGQLDAVNEYWRIEKENSAKRDGLQVKGFWRRNLLNTNSIGFGVFQFMEEPNANRINRAMMRNYGIDPKNPKRVDRLEFLPAGTKSLWDIQKITTDEKKGSSVTYEGLTDEAFADFRRKVRSYVQAIKGTSPSEDRNVASSNIYLKALMLFRTWIYPTAMNRYGSFRYDPGRQDFVVGRHNVLFGELAGTFLYKKGPAMVRLTNVLIRTVGIGIRAIPFGIGNSLVGDSVDMELSKIHYDRFLKKNPNHEEGLDKGISLAQFHKIREQEIEAVLAEIRMVVTLKLLMVAMSVKGDDDKEFYKKNAFTNIAFQIIKPYRLEMLFYYSLKDFRQIINNPVPATVFLSNVASFIGNSVDNVRDFVFGQNELTETGLSADTTPPGSQAVKFIPGARPILNTIDMIAEAALSDEEAALKKEQNKNKDREVGKNIIDRY